MGCFFRWTPAVNFLLPVGTSPLDRTLRNRLRVNLALLLLLALMWSVALLPTVMRSRKANVQRSMGGFHRAMRSLSPNGQVVADRRAILVPVNASRIVAPPSPADRAKERRHAVLRGLLFANGLALTLAVLVGGPFTALAFVVVVALVAYVVALRKLAVAAQQARRLVQLDTHRRLVEEATAALADDAHDDRRAVGT